MYAECLPNWSALAAIWDAFENRGTLPGHLDSWLECNVQLNDLIAVVGCGRGAIVQHIQQSLPHVQVVGLDACQEMVNYAHIRGVPNVYKVRQDAPVPAELMPRIIVVPTGVLDPLDEAELTRLLQHFFTCIPNNGMLSISTFGRLGPLFELAIRLGAVHSLGIHWERILDCCAHNQMDDRLRSVKEWVDSVSHLTQQSFSEALVTLKRVLPRYRRLYQTQSLSEALASTGFTEVQTREIWEDGVVMCSGLKPA